ncbi:Smr-domain-containing protein [Schizopora paradoxa]|uniref:Smr-domain-containing protein n=1 Tax=Schizopora paradoxa TaxID=27342 RepID=A0A0H2RV46_9AGAM|nr:Smr-domain-containing protein [Schizopora paradoxa]
MPLGSSLIVVGAAVFVGGIVCKVIKDYCGAGTQEWRDEDYRRDQKRSLDRKPEDAKPIYRQESGWAATYGSLESHQHEVQQPRRAEAIPPTVRPSISQTPAPRPPTTASRVTPSRPQSSNTSYASVVSPSAEHISPPYERIVVGSREHRTRTIQEEGGWCVESEDVIAPKRGANFKPRSILPSPRSTRTQRRTRENHRVKQKAPRKTKEELEYLIEYHAALSESGSKFTERDKERIGFIDRKAASDLRKRCDSAKFLIGKAFKEGRVDDGRQLIVIRKELHEESLLLDETAAAEIYAHHNPTRFDSVGFRISSSRCDVHGLYVAEAREYVKRFLETCIEKSLREVKVVTGKGIHSEGGEAKLKPAILEFLKGDPDVEEAKIEETNEGCILVRLKLTQSEIVL